MAVIESRLKNGTLAFGGATPVDFSCQATAVTLEPSTDTEEEVETLCGDKIVGASTTTWTLNATSIQDWTNAAGLIIFALENDGTNVPFTWTPNGSDGPTWSGVVRVQAMAIGGDVNSRLTSDLSWPLNGAPSVAWP